MFFWIVLLVAALTAVSVTGFTIASARPGAAVITIPAYFILAVLVYDHGSERLISGWWQLGFLIGVYSTLYLAIEFWNWRSAHPKVSRATVLRDFGPHGGVTFYQAEGGMAYLPATYRSRATH